MTWRTIAAWTLYPVIVIGGMAAGFALVGDADPAIVIGGLGAASMALVALLERAMPYVPAWNRARGDLRADALHLLVSSIGTTQLVDLASRGHGSLAIWPHAWPLIAQVAAALVIGELGQYWAHRALHHRGSLWRVHVVHHGAERLYWLNANRNHPLDVVLQYSSLMVPIVLLGAGPAVLTLTGLFAAIHTPLQHGNVAVVSGPWSYLISTAELHRWHHAPGAAGDVNFGGNLSVWDHVFGTFHRPRGAGGIEVGLDGAPMPRGYLAQIATPFRSIW